MHLLEILVIGIGVLVSFFLKDINFLALNYIYPDFLIIFLIYFSLRRGEFSGLWIGFFAGLLEDSAILSFSASAGKYVNVIGTHMLVYTLTGFVLGKLNRIIDKDRIPPVVVVVFLTTVAVRFCIWLLNGIVQDFDKNYNFFGTAIYTALLAPVWFWLLRFVYRYTSEVEQE